MSFRGGMRDIPGQSNEEHGKHNRKLKNQTIIGSSDDWSKLESVLDASKGVLALVDLWRRS